MAVIVFAVLAVGSGDDAQAIDVPPPCVTQVSAIVAPAQISRPRFDLQYYIQKNGNGRIHLSLRFLAFQQNGQGELLYYVWEANDPVDHKKAAYDYLPKDAKVLHGGVVILDAYYEGGKPWVIDLAISDYSLSLRQASLARRSKEWLPSFLNFLDYNFHIGPNIAISTTWEGLVLPSKTSMRWDDLRQHIAQ